jgi:alkanesulfonate monooxygenase SsuD/methylene tetrahydromethanopterin reductase-like flavin-dependent oxidoreductase (luciferase family)
MVCSVTFRHPALLAKMAMAVSELADGRLDLGLGAGWYQAEHEMFGVPFPRYGTRLDMLEEAAQVIKGLWSGKATTFEGEHYRVQAAETHPTPPQNPPYLIMGGKGTKTLKVVARNAAEWNCSYVGIDVFREKWAELAANCEAIGRDPETVIRSLMVPFVIGEDETAVQARIDAHHAAFRNLPTDYAAWREAGFLGGAPQQLTEQLGEFVEAGVQRFMLQHNDLDDRHSLELMATQVLPHFAE